MESIDTLVYQMEDEDAIVKLDALRRLRQVAAQLQTSENAIFPVRNTRRFLNCVRRRLHDVEPRIVMETLQFVADLIPVVGKENLSHMYQIVLPQMLGMLPGDPEWEDEAAFPYSALHVLWVFAQYTVDLQGIMDLLMNQGLNHEDGKVRESSICALKQMLVLQSNSTLPCGNVEWNMLLEVLIPCLEDDEEGSIVAAEETLGWIQGHLGPKMYQKLVQELNSRDRAILAQHNDFIQQFVSPNSNHLSTDQLQFGLVPKWIVDTLLGAEDKSNAVQLLGKVLEPLQQSDYIALRSEWPSLFGFLAKICAMDSPHRHDLLFILQRVIQAISSYLSNIAQLLLPMLATVLADLPVDNHLRDMTHRIIDAESVSGVIKALIPSLQHRSCKIREQGCKLWTVAALKNPQVGQPAFSTITLHLGRLLCDPSDIVRTAALDLAAVYVHICNISVLDLLCNSNDVQIDGLDKSLVERRLRNRMVPILQKTGSTLFSNGQVEDKTKLWLPEVKPVAKPALGVPKQAVKPEVVQVIPQPTPELIAKNLTVLKQRCLNKKRSTTPENGKPERAIKATTPIEMGEYSENGDREQRIQHTTNFGDDRPIKPMKANFLVAEYELPQQDLTVNQQKASKPISSATSRLIKKKELSKKQQCEPEPEIITPPTIPEADVMVENKPKIMTLATRKRLEAKQKQERAAEVVAETTEFNSKKLKTGDELKLALKAGKQEYTCTSDLQDFHISKTELGKCIAKLQNSEWETQFEGLTDLRRLCVHCPDAVMGNQFGSIVREVCKHIGNLRSAIAKNAMLAVETMCLYLTKRMDNELDEIIPLLLKRAADTNTFLSESGSATIDAVVTGCTPLKILTSLLPLATSKNSNIRKHVAIVLGKIAQNFNRTDGVRLIAILCTLVNDSNNEVRDCAKSALQKLKQLGILDAETLKKSCPASCLTRVEQTLTTTPSPRQLPKTPSTDKIPPRSKVEKDTTKAKPVKEPELEKLNVLQQKLDSSNWKDRFDALAELKEMMLKFSNAIIQSSKLLQIFDGVNKRLEDGNSKVNVYALESLLEIIPAFGNGMESLLPNLVPVLARNLASNNQKIVQLAERGFELLCDSMESKTLCQHLALVIKNGNTRVKPGLILKLHRLVENGSPSNQSAIQRYVLPLALELMKESKNDVREANTKLLRALYSALGPSMLDTAYKLPKTHQEKLSDVLGIHIQSA
ncbi:hypothetical protein THRCLA_09687 [Thraustotheca clavata]|uniref:TOG domain-containing protein n=1 Tax=Thraustotheca clavata TaxID=74557 RepID=A0A1V9YUR5_9STRA|nr:hypothetical protein THRCLA_09687 [Thraustotheca clavata]